MYSVTIYHSKAELSRQCKIRNVTLLARIKKQKQYTNHQLSFKHNTNMQRISCFSSHIQYELIVQLLLTLCYR